MIAGAVVVCVGIGTPPGEDESQPIVRPLYGPDNPICPQTVDGTHVRTTLRQVV